MRQDLQLALSGPEVLLLIDRIRNDDCGEPTAFVQPHDLILKLGGLYLELVQETTFTDGERAVALTEAEAWLLRSKVVSLDKGPGNQPLGIRLLRKVYAMLLAYGARTDLRDGEIDEPAMTAETRDALRRLHEGSPDA